MATATETQQQQQQPVVIRESVATKIVRFLSRTPGTSSPSSACSG